MDNETTIIRVPIPAGTVDLLDPEVIEREVRRGQELNRIQQERDGRTTTPGQQEQRQHPPEPPREEGKHRFLGGTCVDCGHPFDEICTPNLPANQS
jgi:hypothetical protein